MTHDSKRTLIMTKKNNAVMKELNDNIDHMIVANI